jgi:O-acetyl-ADP-ribose deacetylase (regulator of RNase III)
MSQDLTMAMVRPQVGDLFASEAQTLVNTVNTVGVMGKGIALQFRNRFPEMHRDYVRKCELGEVVIGKPYLWAPAFDRWVLNFPTKRHWRSAARLADIVAGLDYLRTHYADWGITSMAVPPLGCGEGGLEWRVVGPTLYQSLRELAIPIDLYAPFGTPSDQLEHEFLSTPIPVAAAHALKLSPGAVALAEIVGRVSAEPFHSPIGRIAFQKVAYFATQAGVPTGLKFTEGSYGPFSPDVKVLRSKLENNGVLVERQLGRMFETVPGPTFADARQVYGSWLEKWEPPIDRVADLFLRLRTTRQAEVAATAHFAAQAVAASTSSRPAEMDVLAYVRRWKQGRRPSIEDAEYGLAIRQLNASGWLAIEFSEELPLPAHERELALV